MKDYKAAAATTELPLPLLMAACSSSRERPRLILPPAHNRRAFTPSQISHVLPAGVADDCWRNTRLGGKSSSFPLCLDGKEQQVQPASRSHPKGVLAKFP